MRLVHKNIDTIIDFNQNCGWQLIIENSSEYYNLMCQINSQIDGEEGDFVLSQNYSSISMEKSAIFIWDYLNLSVNNNKIDKLLNAKIIENFNGMDYFQKLSQINSLFIDINESLVNNFDLPICYDEELTIEKFIKLSSYKIQEEQPLIDKILSYIDVYIELKTPKLIIFGAVTSVLSRKNIDILINELTYKQINFIFLENVKRYELSRLKTIIVDEDLCVI